MLMGFHEFSNYKTLRGNSIRKIKGAVLNCQMSSVRVTIGQKSMGMFSRIPLTTPLCCQGQQKICTIFGGCHLADWDGTEKNRPELEVDVKNHLGHQNFDRLNQLWFKMV